MNDLRLLSAIEINDEPRIRDTDLAERLGFERPRKIRELIYRNRDELLHYGSLPYEKLETVSPRGGAKPKSPRGGRPEMVCMLNEGQALLICMFSQTERAADVRKLVIDTFMDWRAGKTVHVKEHMRRPPVPAAPSFEFTIAQYGDGPMRVDGRVPVKLALAMYALYVEHMTAALPTH